jgi:hypothetical protein
MLVVLSGIPKGSVVIVPASALLGYTPGGNQAGEELRAVAGRHAAHCVGSVKRRASCFRPASIPDGLFVFRNVSSTKVGSR